MTHDNDCVFNACVYIKHKCKLMRFQPLKVPFFKYLSCRVEGASEIK